MTTHSAARLPVVYSFPDTLGAPGIGTTAWNQVQGLIGLGHEVRVYATALARDLPSAEVVTTLTLAGRRVPHRAVGRRRAYRYHDHQVGNVLRQLAGQVDVVHCWSRATLETAAAREAGVASVRETPNTHTAYAYERVAAETERLGLLQPQGHSHTPDARLGHPSVTVQGFVPDVAALMRASDVLVLPTVEEGSALATYEAQASGCVPVVSDAAGARCTHLEDGLVHEAGDVIAVTDHLRLLDRNPELLARLRARTLAGRHELTWEQGARDLERLYRELVAR